MVDLLAMNEVVPGLCDCAPHSEISFLGWILTAAISRGCGCNLRNPVHKVYLPSPAVLSCLTRWVDN